MNNFNFNEFLYSAPTTSGIYKMLSLNNECLYVGKAKNLKSRLSSYFKQNNLHIKNQKLVEKIANIEIIITSSEKEALILEQTLIKELKPPFNILLRDDKSYPYICLSNDEFPYFNFFRSKTKSKGTYFGPYPNVLAVKDILSFIHKTFKIRNCNNVFFKNRTRPCLQYQINRCKAPCVNLVDQDEYGKDVKMSVLFLTGKSKALVKSLTHKMQQASDSLNFEEAAYYRNTITNINQLSQLQNIETEHQNSDVVTIYEFNKVFAINVTVIRFGKLIDNKNYLFDNLFLDHKIEVLNDFLQSFYLNIVNNDCDKQVFLYEKSMNFQIIEEIVLEKFDKQIKFKTAINQLEKSWLENSLQNAKQFLEQHTQKERFLQERIAAMEDIFKTKINRMECFDVSHTFGEETVASCVVFDGFKSLKSKYRIYNIKNAAKSDDIGAMFEVLNRRFNEKNNLPDLLFVDGGVSQLNVAINVLQRKNITTTKIASIAKGEGRKPGLETIYYYNNGQIETIEIQSHSAVFNFIMNIRDEAHRFAITKHRQKRDKKRKTSILENINGVGKTRRESLLLHFGSLDNLKNANITQIMEVAGINLNIAKNIYNFLHPKNQANDYEVT